MTPYDVVHSLNKLNRIFQIHSVNFEKNGNITQLKLKNQIVGILLSVFSVIFQTISIFKLLYSIGGRNIVMDISRVIMYFSVNFTCLTFLLKTPTVKYAEMSNFLKNMKNINQRLNSDINYGYIHKSIFVIFTLLALLTLSNIYYEVVRPDFGVIYLHIYFLVFIINSISVTYVTEARLMNIQAVEFNKELLKLIKMDDENVQERILSLSKVCEKMLQNLDNFNKKFGLTVCFFF